MIDAAKATLLIQVFTTFMMVGIIWFIQIVHYPLYSKIKEGFPAYEKMHLRRTSYIVGPIMLIEAVSAIFLVGLVSDVLMARLASLNLIFVILIWLSTFLFQVFQHQRLAVRFSHRMHHILLNSNWFQTICWTCKAIILLWMLIFYLVI
ncbi:MAG: hypothetical protein Tsb0015_16260 [Simkaniaceae bacterium]